MAQATSKKISGIEGLSPAKGFIDGIPHNRRSPAECGKYPLIYRLWYVPKWFAGFLPYRDHPTFVPEPSIVNFIGPSQSVLFFHIGLTLSAKNQWVKWHHLLICSLFPEISNERTHCFRTPKKPEYSTIATYRTGSVGIRSHSIFDGLLQHPKGEIPIVNRESIFKGS